MSLLCNPFISFAGGGGSGSTNRDDLVYGAYEPDETTAGLLSEEAELEPYNLSSANTVTIANNEVIEDKIIYGDVTFAGNATLRNCLLVGGNNAITSGNTGVLRCINSRTGVAKLYDCRIRPRKESDGRDCALGWQYELYRCHLSGGVDGCGIYKTSSPYACNVKVYGCLIEDTAYTYPDRDHDDGTHNDCIQIQGGTSIEVVGNSLRGYSHPMTGAGANPDKPWLLSGSDDWANGAGLIIQKNIGGAPAFNSTVKINDNYFRGGLAQLLIKSTANGFECKRNKFSTVDEPANNVSPTYNSYWIRFDAISSSSNVDGLTSGGSLSNTTNVWLDGGSAGAALSTPRASGVQSDA